MNFNSTRNVTTKTQRKTINVHQTRLSRLRQTGNASVIPMAPAVKTEVNEIDKATGIKTTNAHNWRVFIGVCCWGGGGQRIIFAKIRRPH